MEGVKDPVGMTGIRLEVDTFIIGASTAAIRNMTRAVTSAGVHINELVFSPLATAEALLTKQQKENGVVLVDIGSNTTSFIIFEEGDVVHASVLPIGSSHITNDIAIGLRTTLDIAEQVKQNYAYALSRDIDDDEVIELSEFDPEEETTTHRKYVCEIVEARLGELFSMLREELRLIGKDGMLPAGVVFTGGGARLSGLTSAAKDMLQLPAQIGAPSSESSGMIDKLDDPLYATSVGLMLSGLMQPSQGPRLPASFGNPDTIVNSIFDKAKGFLKNLLP
jgi:cell division protein FtsA